MTSVLRTEISPVSCFISYLVPSNPTFIFCLSYSVYQWPNVLQFVSYKSRETRKIFIGKLERNFGLENFTYSKTEFIRLAINEKGSEQLHTVHSNQIEGWTNIENAIENVQNEAIASSVNSNQVQNFLIRGFKEFRST